MTKWLLAALLALLPTGPGVIISQDVAAAGDAPTFVAAAFLIGGENSTHCTPTMPTVQTDDYAILICQSDNGETHEQPTGYTAVYTGFGTGTTCSAWWKKVTAGEGNATCAWGTAEDSTCAVVVVRGVHATVPIDAVSSPDDRTTSTDPTAEVVTVTQADTFVITQFGQNGAAVVTADSGYPSGTHTWTGVYVDDTVSGGATGGGVAYFTHTDSSATAADAWLASNIVNNNGCDMTFALAPP